MKKTLVISALIVMMICCSSCDFFRKLVGRPTSADIEAKLEMVHEKERERLEQKRIEDSVKLANSQQEETMALQTIANHNFTTVSVKRLKLAEGVELTSGYYIVLGAFSNHDNATRLVEKLKKAGYDAETIPYSNGLMAVAACPMDDFGKISARYAEMEQSDLLPKNAWILVNN